MKVKLLNHDFSIREVDIRELVPVLSVPHPPTIDIGRGFTRATPSPEMMRLNIVDFQLCKFHTWRNPTEDPHPLATDAIYPVTWEFPVYMHPDVNPEAVHYLG